MVKLFIIFVLCLLQTPINIGGQASVKKINWQDGKIIEQQEYQYLTNFTISEKDSLIVLGKENHKISQIIATDSVVTYIVVGMTDKEYVYDYDITFTQKNIKWRSHGLETWFQYKLWKPKNNNEFEFGG